MSAIRVTACALVLTAVGCNGSSGQNDPGSSARNRPEERVRSDVHFGPIEGESVTAAQASVREGVTEPFWSLEYGMARPGAETLYIWIPSIGEFPEGTFDIATYRTADLTGEDVGIRVEFSEPKEDSSLSEYQATAGIAVVTRTEEGVHVELNDIQLRGSNAQSTTKTLAGEITSELIWSCHVLSAGPAEEPSTGTIPAPMMADGSGPPSVPQYMADSALETEFCQQQVTSAD
jgi:hypothetical protein